MLTTTVALLASAALLGGATAGPVALDLGKPQEASAPDAVDPGGRRAGLLSAAGTTGIVVLVAAVAGSYVVFSGLNQETLAGDIDPWLVGGLAAAAAVGLSAPVFGAMAGDTASGMSSSWLWVELAGCGPSGVLAGALAAVSLADGGAAAGACLLCAAAPIVTIAGTSLAWWMTAEPSPEPPARAEAMPY